MVTTVEPTNVEIVQAPLRRALRSWRFWVGAIVVAGLVAGWGLTFHNYSLSEKTAASVATLDERTSAVKQREDAVKGRENAVTKQERTIARNTIGEGDWAAGVDVRPGPYRTTGAASGDCYLE